MATRKPAGYWTKERCIEATKECTTISEFKNNYSGAYKSIIKNKWQLECFAHMENFNPERYQTQA